MIFALKPESMSFARIFEGFEKDRLLNAICLLSLPRIVKDNLQIDFGSSVLGEYMDFWGWTKSKKIVDQTWIILLL